MYVYIHIHSLVVGISHKNLSWFSWEYSYALIPTFCGHAMCHVVCFHAEDPKQLAHPFSRLGCNIDCRQCGALSPYGKAACSQTPLGSTLVLVIPFQTVTKDLDNWSEGLDWLGTLSNQIWLQDFSSREKIFLSRKLLTPFCDQDFKKLPRTDSLSEKATTRFPFTTGSQSSAAMSSANISSSWIIFFCSSFLTEERNSQLNFSLKKKQACPVLS